MENRVGLTMIQLNARAAIKYNNKILFLSDKTAPRNTIAGFEIDNANADLRVWSISDLAKYYRFSTYY